MEGPDLQAQVKRVNKLLALANKTNTRRDKLDRKLGMAAPPDCPLKLHLRTVEQALMAGITIEDWEVIAEGIDMLIQAIGRVPDDDDAH
jgi:hypothetical protein